MLTKDERNWLNDREIFLAGLGHYIWDSYYWDEDLPFEDMKEAAEFEARVVAKLADPYYPPMDSGSDGPQLFMPPADRLKWARIEVEEEIDAENG